MKTDIEVRISETDAAGHVYHANHLIYFEVGRIEFMKAKGFSLKERWEKGIVLPVVEAFCQYKSQAYLGDILTVDTTLEEAEGKHVKFSYTITCGERLVARGYTVHVFTVKGKPVPIPDDILRMLLS
jgi:acyl-CoA thioester hydrolase